MKHCVHCGAQLDDSARFCTECGALCEEEAKPTDQKAQRKTAPLESPSPEAATEPLYPPPAPQDLVPPAPPAPPTPPAPPAPSASQRKLSTPQIVGLCIAGVVVIALIVGAVLFFTSPGNSSADGQDVTPTQAETQDGQQDQSSQTMRDDAGVTHQDQATDHADADSSSAVDGAAESSAGASATVPHVQAQSTGSYPPLNVPFNHIEASSTLPTSNYGTYNAANVADGDNATAWVEGAQGSGVGSEITFSNPSTSAALSELAIRNGYTKSEDLYYKNARPCDITIFADGQPLCTATLKDSYASLQVISFGKQINPSTITIRIDSVYSGTKYEDCAITELGFR